jgi:hypothetical protein
MLAKTDPGVDLLQETALLKCPSAALTTTTSLPLSPPSPCLKLAEIPPPFGPV